MANLNKTQSGLLFFDDFSEKTLMWTLSPSDANCLSFGDNGLQINHTRRYVTYTIIEPSADEYSCIVKIDHIPAKLTDIAGIIVMSNVKEYAECQSFMATGPSEIGNSEDIYIDIENMVKDILAKDYVKWEEEPDSNTPENNNDPIVVPAEDFIDKNYQYIKFTKTKYKYIFYASETGTSWIEIGNVKFENSGVVGFFIYGTDDDVILNQSHCYINSFAIYNSKYLTIEGIDRQYEMEIYDENANILMRTDNIAYAHMLSRSNKTCVINTTTMPTPIKNAKLRIYSKTNYMVTLHEFDLGDSVYGGDGFTLERNLGLYINNTLIQQDTLYDLGEFYRGSYFIKLDVHNNENYSVTEVKLKVIRYSEYYGGEEEVLISLHSDNIPPSDLFYQKEIIIGEIQPSEGKSIYLKLSDKPLQDFYNTANSYRFKIIIE